MSARKLDEANPKTTLDSVLNFGFNNCETTVCLASIDDQVPKFEKLQLSEGLTEDFLGVVRGVVEGWKKHEANGDLVLRDYDAGSKPDSHEIEHVDLSEHSFTREQIASLSSIADVAIFTNDSDFLSGLRFYVIIIQPKDGEPVYCFRLYSQKKEIHRSKVFAALLTQGHFDRVKQPMFLFDQHMDCVSRGNVMFVFNKDRFQKIFRFFEMIMKTAKETLKVIKAQIPISNYDDFEKACEGHLQMVAKLKNIASKPYIDKITINDLKRVINKFNSPVQ